MLSGSSSIASGIISKKSVLLRRSTGQFFDIEAGSVFQHEVDGAAELAGEDGVAFELAMFFFESAGKGIELFVVTFAEDGGFAESPAQVGVAEFGSAQAFDLSGAGDGAFDETTVTQEVLHGGEALDSVDFVEHGQPEGFSNSGRGAQESEITRLVAFGDGEEFFFQGLDRFVILDNEMDILLQSKAVTWIIVGSEKGFEPFGAVVAEFRYGHFVLRKLHGGNALEQLDALPHVGSSLAKQGTDGPFLCRVDVGGWNEIAAQEVSELFRIDSIVFVFAAMDGLEVKGVSEHELESGLLAGIGEPIPAEEAFAADRHVVPPGSDLFEEELEVVVLNIHVQEFVSCPVHHADIHLA